METTNNTVITVSATVNAPLAKVWEYWTKPEHIIKWNSASPGWHTPSATVDLRAGGAFTSRMEAKDGSMGFDFGGTYDVVKTNEQLKYSLADGRRVSIDFAADGDTTKIIESFDAETTNPIEMQQGGWQAILDNFKKYTEEN